MSDRIAVFNDGRIQQLATPDDLYERPANSFVAQFIGENNKISGTVVAVNGGSCHVEVEGGGRVEALPVAVQTVGSPTTLSLRSEEHTSELQSLMRISYAVFCLKKNKHRLNVST